MTAQAELIVDSRCSTGESPVWLASEQTLYWVDIPTRQLHCWRAGSGEVEQWQAPEMIGCIAACGPGVWLAAMESGLFRIRSGTSAKMTAESVARVDHPFPGMRFNDGRCDRQGRFWAGTMLVNMAAGSRCGSMYRCESGFGLERILDGFIVPNGLAFSPDGRTMYLSDSHPGVQMIWAFDYDTGTGTPSNRRVFVDMKPLPGRPDGAAMDQDGCYWICGNDAGLVHRFTPEGRLDRSLVVPVKKPAMCAFGGAAMDTLFVTSIRPVGIDLSDQPLAGGVFALRPGVKGMPEPHFSC